VQCSLFSGLFYHDGGIRIITQSSQNNILIFDKIIIKSSIETLFVIKTGQKKPQTM
jgi:hypothetical protein